MSTQLLLDHSNESNTLRLILAYLPSNHHISISEDSHSKAPTLVEGHKIIDDWTSIAIALCESDQSVKDTLLGDEDRKKQVLDWIKYVRDDLLPAIRTDQLNKIKPVLAKLSKKLETIVFLVSNRLSLADLVVFGTISVLVKGWSEEETHKSDDISRWYDNIQHLRPIQNVVEQYKMNISFKKNVPKPLPKKPEEIKTKPEQPNKGKGEHPNTKSQQDSGNMLFSRLDMRVGKIVKADPHPEADTLYVEEIDVGEGKNRNVVSGLAKFVPLEEMKNRMVVVLCNIKPANFRKIRSEAMVICASNDEHTEVETLTPPPGCVPGDRLYVEDETSSKVPCDPVINLSSKINTFQSLQQFLGTNDECIAVFKGKPLLTSQGTLSVVSMKNSKLG